MSFDIQVLWHERDTTHLCCVVSRSQINIFNSIELMSFHDADTPHGCSDMIAAHRFRLSIAYDTRSSGYGMHSIFLINKKPGHRY